MRIISLQGERSVEVNQSLYRFVLGFISSKIKISCKLPRKKIAFGWYGGKFSHLDWLLPLLPHTKHYCEPFGGSAAVLLNRKPSPVETYNDIDSELVNFFRVLRNQREELIQNIGLTPFSREELRNAVNPKITSTLTELERARRFFVRARQVRTGLAQTASEGRWAYCRLTSRAGMAGSVSRWLGSVEGLSEIVQRLLRVQIENGDAVSIIKRYDSPQTLFYCDPPYPHDSRSDVKAYAYEMTDDQHRELGKILQKVKGYVAISGYESDLLDEIYGNWHKTAGPVKKANSIKKERQELLFTNYDPTSLVISSKL